MTKDKYAEENEFVRHLFSSIPGLSPAKALQVLDVIKEDSSIWRDEGKTPPMAKIFSVYNLKLQGLAMQPKIAPGTYEDDAALNRSYGRMEMLAEAAMGLLAYPAAYFEMKGLRKELEGGAVLAAPPFNGIVSSPTPVGTEEFWRFRADNAREMGMGKVHELLLNDFRAALLKMFTAVHDHHEASLGHGKDPVVAKTDAFTRFRDSRNALRKSIIRLETEIENASEQFYANGEIAAERGNSIDPATQRCRAIIRLVQSEIIPQFESEIGIVQQRINNLSGYIRPYQPPVAMLESHADAELIDLPTAAPAPVEQPTGEDLEIGKEILNGQGGLITSEELSLARALKQSQTQRG